MGGRHTREAVDQAALPLYEQDAYRQQANTLATAWTQKALDQIPELTGSIIEKLGGKEVLARGSAWEQYAPGKAGEYGSNVEQFLGWHRDEWVDKTPADGDPFDQAVLAVALYGRAGATARPDESGDNSALVQLGIAFTEDEGVPAEIGASFAGMAESEVLADPAMQRKAEETIDMLIRLGLYRLYRWQDPRQLETAVQLIEHFSERTPGFNPTAAGLELLRSNLRMSLSVLEADVQTKPHLAETNEDNVDLRLALRRAMRTSSMAMAHEGLEGVRAAYAKKAAASAGARAVRGVVNIGING